MALHILKLCVGIASAQELRDRIASSATALGREAGSMEVSIVTRMVPSRADEIVGKGSLYWVIKGHVAARQAIRGIQPFTDHTGTGRCQILLAPEVVDVTPRQRKPFQGWRYLEEADVPPDVAAGNGGGLAEMPEAMRRELAELGLL